MMRSNALFVFGIAVVTWAALIPSTAHAATVPALTITGGTANSTVLLGDNNFGWSFTVSETIQVGGLGVYDHNQDGLSSSHRVRLWHDFGALIVSTLIPSGTGASLIDQFRYNIFAPPPFPLFPGTYFVTATYASGDGDNFLSLATGLATDPRIAYLGDAFSLAAFPPEPFGAAGNPQFFGPNFLLVSDVSEVPLPAAVPLFATSLGLFGLLGWRRRRKLAA
jgi:hypothetical protein